MFAVAVLAGIALVLLYLIGMELVKRFRRPRLSHAESLRILAELNEELSQLVDKHRK